MNGWLLMRIGRVLRLLLRKEQSEQQLDEEMRFHLQRQIEQNIASGMNPEEARLAALRLFGGVEQIKEECRDMRGTNFIENLLQDLRYGVRMLAKNPTFAAVAVITLALGIGANTAIFSVVNAVLLRPLPYPRSDAIVEIKGVWKDGGLADDLTVPEFEFYRNHASAFAAIAGYRGGPDLSIKRGGVSEWITSLRVTDGFFKVLGVAPALGRGVLREETRPGSAQSVILSDSLWRKAFGSDPAVIGRQVVLGDASFTVVGVMPPDFTFVEQQVDVFVPLQLGTGIEDTGMNTSVIARLQPATSLAQGQANMNVVFEQLRQAGSAQSGQAGARLLSYQTALAGDLRPSLLMLFGAVGLLLLIACANVASLIMARANARQREISIRLALGAERWRLLQQFLAESLLIALMGGAAGLVAAVWALKLLVSSIPWDLPSTTHIGLDGSVLAFTSLVALGTSLAFGFTSYWQTSRLDPNTALKEGSTQGGRSTAGSRGRNVLVIGEVALSLMLLVGAGLLIESLYRLHQQRLGFDPQHVYTMNTPFAPAERATANQVWIFEQQVLERIKAVPGVTSAGVVSLPPLTCCGNLPTQHEGHPEHDQSIGGMEYRAISPEYFQTMHIPILQGRNLQETDTASSTPVVIVGETVAALWWKGKNPIGDRLVVGEYEGRQFPEVLEPPREVVGVVGDVKNISLEESDPTTIYVPASQLFRPPNSTAWVVRASSNLALGEQLRQAVTAVNPDQRVLGLQSMSDVVARAVAHPTFDVLLMGTFAALALTLTSVGIYGVLSFHLARRTQEIGIRIALGAKRGNVLLMVVGQGAFLAAVGIGIGLVGALVLSRFLSSLLYGVKPTDPPTFIAVSLILAAVALLASYIPARRATKVDPMVALRYE
ncbi:MAG TPA: ABC transporter permease [Terriglobia bacterium]|nr:ABC transporter permease [Terriglobia bacterium]